MRSGLMWNWNRCEPRLRLTELFGVLLAGYVTTRYEPLFTVFVGC